MAQSMIALLDAAEHFFGALWVRGWRGSGRNAAGLTCARAQTLVSRVVDQHRCVALLDLMGEAATAHIARLQEYIVTGAGSGPEGASIGGGDDDEAGGVR